MPANTEAISGIAGGLNASMGNLMGYAREQRAINTPENQYRQAVSAEALKQMQEDQQKITREQLIKTNPRAGKMIDAAKNAGLIVGDEQEFTRGKIKETQAYFNKNPKVMLQILNQSHQESVKQIGDIDVAISKEQEKLKPLMDNPVGNADKIKGIQEKIAGFENQKAPLMKQRLDDSNATDYYKMIDSAQTVEQLPAAYKPYGMKLLEQGQQVTMEKVMQMYNTDQAALKSETRTPQKSADMGRNIPADIRSKYEKERGVKVDPGQRYEYTLKPDGTVDNIIGLEKPSFGAMAQRDMVDIRTGESVPMTGEEFAQADKKNYVSASQWNKNAPKATLLLDIRGSLGRVKEAVNAPGVTFNDAQRVQLRQAVNALEPNTALANLINGEFGRSLNEDQMNYLARVQQLTEQSMSMRSILGAGQSSEMLRKAIISTIPSAGTFSKDYANKQITEFNKVLDRLEPSVPSNIMSAVKKLQRGEEPAPSSSPTPSGAPNQTMTESQARKALTDKGIKGKEQDDWIKKYKDAGKLTSQSEGIRFASNEAAPEDVPLGTGTADKAKNAIINNKLQTLQQLLELEDNEEEKMRLREQINRLRKQMKDVG